MEGESNIERHIECSECRKQISVIYTEIVGKTIYRIGMCQDCPILRQKLYKIPHELQPQTLIEAGLCCAVCGTNANEIKMGALLGCSNCYEVFNELITSELVNSERFPQKIEALKPMDTLHLGRMPGQPLEINPALKLLALHQALNETLGREDYEQAAWLRDQIKALTEEGNGKKQKSK